MNRGTRLSLAGTILLFAAIGASCLDNGHLVVGPPPPPTGILPPTGWALRPSVTAAMHLHGWSNHSASQRPASIAWHTQQHAAAGVDLLWWTDHPDVYAYRLSDFVITPTSPVRISATTWRIGTWSAGAAFAFLRGPVGSTPTVDSVHSLIVVATPPGDPGRRDTVELFFGTLAAGTSSPRRAAITLLARPLVGDPRFSLVVNAVTRDGSLPDVDVLVPLAWHPRGVDGYRQVLRYEFGEQQRAGTRAVGDTVEYTRPLVPGDSAVIGIAPKADANAAFADGADNTTDEYRVRFIVARGADSTRFWFRLPRIANATSTSANQMPAATQAAHDMAASFGVRSIWGIEEGAPTAEIRTTRWESVSGAGRHLAVYMPTDVTPALFDSLSGDARALSAFVRSRGGLTSIAHPFGTAGGLPTNSWQENQALVEDLGSLLVRNGAWGAPLIEVGYTSRGGVGITEHLELLDYLLASGISICGVGVTDSHGGRVLADPDVGSPEQFNFVTWIGGVDRLAPTTDILNAIRDCHVSFGNPFYVHGGLWIDLDADSGGNPRLAIDAHGLSPSAALHLFEVEIDSTGTPHAPTYRQLGVIVSASSMPPVGGCRASVARLEAWVGDRPLAFSNVVRVPPDPRKCP